MNKYETVMIIQKDMDDMQEVISKFTNLINLNGKVTRIDDMGVRNLAYSIAGNKQGYYVVVEFEAKEKFIPELERNYRITNAILKFIVVKQNN